MKKSSEIFNEHYIKIVEKSSGSKPSSLGESANSFTWWNYGRKNHWYISRLSNGYSR